MNDCNRRRNWYKCSELTRQKMIRKDDCDEFIMEEEERRTP